MATMQKNGLMSMTLTNTTVKNAVKSYTMSKRYINAMLRATVINILYHRLHINKKEFITKVFNKIEYYIPKTTSKNFLIKEFNVNMLACKDALEKNYLKQFYMYFVNSETNDVIEHYKFSFNYGSRDQPIQISQIEETLYENTSELLQILQEFKEHEKLSEEVEVQVELAYFHDTPDDYEPPGFTAVDESETFARMLEKRGNVVTIGKLNTGFHKLNCNAKGGMFLLDDTQTTNDSDRWEGVPEDNSLIDIDEHENFSETIDNVSKNCTLDDTEIASTDSKNRFFDCPCEIQQRYDMLWSPDIITCSVCHQNSHAACQGYLDNTFLDGPFKCDKCKERTNEDTMDLNFHTSLSFCRIRYVLGYIYKFSRVPTFFEQLFGDTMETLKRVAINMEDGKKGTLNVGIFEKLFNCIYKSPSCKKIIYFK